MRIPISVLSTADWNLTNVERLRWNKDAQNRTYFVDDIVLRDITPPTITSLDIESDTVLRLTLSERYDPATIRPLAHYALSSSTDPVYATPRAPVDTGMHYRVQGFRGSPAAPAVRYEIFLRFPTPLRNGHAYTLTVQGIADTSGNLIVPVQVPFTYDDRVQTNTNIQVNQVGYRPNAPKVGYVGGYCGDLGGGAWAVGAGGAIFAWDDQSGWQSVLSPVTTTLRAVAATREDDAWAVGDGGVILHWDAAPGSR